MTIRVAIQPQVYQTNLNNMLYGSSDAVLGRFKGIPRGKFTNLSGPVTQFTAQETAFRIITDSPGVSHTIRATLLSNDTRSNVLKVRNRVVEKQFVPVNTTTTEFIALLKGENLIEVFTENDSTFTSVISSHVGTFVTTYAREIFSSTQNPLDEQTRALFSDFSSRMTEILIPFQDLYADPKSLRTLISRFVTRSYMTKSGSTQGVRDFAAALLGTTPLFVPTQTDQTTFEPDVVPLFKSQLEFGGYEAHAWIPNYEIVHWLAFIRLINNSRHFYNIQEIGEHEVLVVSNVKEGGLEERHLFDFDDPAATAYSEFTFTDFRIVVEILDKLFLSFCAAAYPFDLFVTEDNPLGQKRLAFDSNIDFDSGDLLDAPALDPGAEGWVGLSLTGRFEEFAGNSDPVIYALDSLFITPGPSSGLEDCVYDGYFTQLVSTFSSEQSLDIDVEAEGELNDPLSAATLESHEIENTLMDFSDFGNFSLGGIDPGSISSYEGIAMAGTSSVKHSIVSPDANNFPIIDYSGPAQDWSDAGGQTVYLTVFIGEKAYGTETNVDGIRSFPGSLDGIGVFAEDSLGRARNWRFDKEDLREGVNVLPIFIDFPDAGISEPGFDSSDITVFRLVPNAVVGNSLDYASQTDQFLSGMLIRGLTSGAEATVASDTAPGTAVNYTNQTVEDGSLVPFLPGQNIVGSFSGATGTVLADLNPGTTAGTLTFSDTSDSFLFAVGEDLLDADTLEKYAEASSPEYLANGTLTIDNVVGDFLSGEILASVEVVAMVETLTNRATTSSLRYSSLGWDDLYFGRLHKLDPEGTYRPSRAKVELEDVDNVAPESLWGSELTFTDRYGDTQVLVADPSYNVDGDAVYIPGRYKIQRTVGAGSEGFNRDQTAENLRQEASRHVEGLVKSSTYLDPSDERYVNLFTESFSPTGNETALTFTNPNPGPDLIDITGFSGGSVGSSEGLTGDLGSAMAQQFELTGAGTVSYLELHLHRIGFPVGTIAVSLHENRVVGGVDNPGDLIERCEGVLTRSIPGGVPEHTLFRLFDPVDLLAGTPYWIVVAGNPTYAQGMPLYRSGFDEQFPPFPDFGAQFGNPMWTWIGTVTGSASVTVNSRSITLTAPPGFDDGIQTANPLDLFDFTNFELSVELSGQVASGGGFPMASGGIFINWYDDALTLLGAVAVGLTAPANNNPVLDMNDPLFNPPPGATKFGLQFSAFDNVGSLTLDNVEIREKNTRSIGSNAQNQIVWTKETGVYPYPRSKTTTDLVPVAGSVWVTDASEQHYFRVIGS